MRYAAALTLMLLVTHGVIANLMSLLTPAASALSHMPYRGLAKALADSQTHAATALQVVLSHTPYRELAKELGDKPVVISGRGADKVAKAYGFTRAVTTSQLSAAYPTAVPFCHDPGLLAAQASVASL